MSIYKCPFCGSSEVYDWFDGQALRCGSCDEIGVMEEFVSKSKKSEKIKRIKKFDDEIPQNNEEVIEPEFDHDFPLDKAS